jgi:WD40 repeat protein
MDGGAFSPDGKQVLVARWAEGIETILLWDVAKKAIAKRVVGPNRLRAIGFSSDGQTVVACFRRGYSMSGNLYAKTWEGESLPVNAYPFLHDQTVSVAAFSLDGKAVVANAANGARIWRLPPSIDKSAKQIQLWVQLTTGHEFAEDGTIRSLDTSMLRESRRHLDELGGPPVP